jgi:large subunit ribosomal protein L30
MAAKLRVTLRRSTVGTNPSARGTVRALGLRRIGQTVELPDDPAVRGQIRAVRYLVECEESQSAPATKKTTRRKTSAEQQEEAEA